MKRILYNIVLGVGLMFAATSCSDFLETSSSSDVDQDFVFSDPTTARAALKNAYETWRSDGSVHSNGLFYDLVVCGSDAERHPEAYSSQTRHIPENLYGDASVLSSYSIDSYKSAWSNLYSVIAMRIR
ncbi:MAG: hypothetical protein WCR45_12105 [Bacteroidaceae bacterium]